MCLLWNHQRPLPAHFCLHSCVRDSVFLALECDLPAPVFHRPSLHPEWTFLGTSLSSRSSGGYPLGMCQSLQLSANTMFSWDIASSYNHGAAANLKPTLVWGLTVGRMILNGTTSFLGRHMAVSTVTYTFISMHQCLFKIYFQKNT